MNIIVPLLDSRQMVEVSSTWVNLSEGHEVHCQTKLWNHSGPACHNYFVLFILLYWRPEKREKERKKV